jgi:hypothetical protein
VIKQADQCQLGFRVCIEPQLDDLVVLAEIGQARVAVLAVFASVPAVAAV